MAGSLIGICTDLAFSAPALIAGVAATTFGLHSTALVYSASLATLVAAAAGILLVRQAARPPRPLDERSATYDLGNLGGVPRLST